MKQGNDCHKAVCILCNNKVIDITRMGVSALVSHAAGAKHKERLRTYNPISNLCFMNKNVNKDTPKSLVTPSYYTCLNVNELFRKMFPDIQVAKSCQLSKTKCAYYVVFGLAPYFKELLVKDIKLSPFYLLEGLNNKLQEEETDISIRFWDDTAGEAATRYFESRFFKWPNVGNILEELFKATTNLLIKSLSMLSMDGPNTNCSVNEKLKNIWSREEVPQLFEVGSCGLHVIHGAFQSAVKTIGWELEKFLKACGGYSMTLQPEEIHILP